MQEMLELPLSASNSYLFSNFFRSDGFGTVGGRRILPDIE